MVVSLVLGFLAMIVATMGMKCTNCAGDDKVKKARIAMVGGIIFIVAGEPQVQGGPRGLGQAGCLGWPLTISLLSPGLAALTACSWSGNQIIRDFYNPMVPMNVK